MTTALASYVGIAEETTYGTYVAPGSTSFLPLLSNGLQHTRGIIKSPTLITNALGPDASQIAAGEKRSSGSISLPLYRGDVMRLLLEHCLGVETGNGSVATPYTYIPTIHKGKGLSITVGKPHADGTIEVSAYVGCKIKSWSIGVSAGGEATLDLDIVAQSFDNAQSAPTITEIRPSAYNFVHAAITVGGSSRTLSALTISGDNGFNDSVGVLGSDEILEPLTESDRAHMFEPTVYDLDDTDIDAYLAGVTASALIATFTAGVDVLKFVANGVLLDGADPTMSGKSRVEQNLKYECVTAGGVAGTELTVTQWDTGVPT